MSSDKQTNRDISSSSSYKTTNTVESCEFCGDDLNPPKDVNAQLVMLTSFPETQDA